MPINKLLKKTLMILYCALEKILSLLYQKSWGRGLCYLKTNFFTMIKFWGKVIFLPSKIIEEGRARLARTGNVNVETEIIVK